LGTKLLKLLDKLIDKLSRLGLPLDMPLAIDFISVFGDVAEY
jgi:hypothetical protein